jgi:hypothetical protein
MKLRNAAALAVLGWYLMIPRTGRDYPIGNVVAPLSQWMKRPTIYRDKEECEHVLDRHRRLANWKNRRSAESPDSIEASAGDSGCGFLLLQSIRAPTCLFNFYFLFRHCD